MNNNETVSVFVQLLEEGTPTARGTQAISMGNDTYKLLATPHYDPEDEVWEFLPGSVVRCKMVRSAQGEDLLLAFEKVV